MGLVRDLATYAAGSYAQSRKKRPGAEGYEGGPPGVDTGQPAKTGGDDQAKRPGLGQAIARSEAGKKRSAGMAMSDYSVSGMGLAGPVPGGESDNPGSARRKRGNGKDRG